MLQRSNTLVDYFYKLFRVKCEPCILTKEYRPIITQDDMPEWRSTHLGQRKLLLSEIMFLSLCLDQPNTVVVYAGAAPCDHLSFLLKLFPTVSFVLVDPERWCQELATNRYFLCKSNYTDKPVATKVNSRVTVYHGLFTDSLAHCLGEQFAMQPLLFISDVRPTNLEDQCKTINERNDVVKQNMEMQKTWYHILNSYRKVHAKAMFKFKPIMTETYTRYLSGDLFYQAWSQLRSTELRLITMNSQEDKDYDNRWLEKHLCYLNEVERNNITSCVPTASDCNGLFDTRLEYAICQLYISSGGSASYALPQDMMKDISASLQFKDMNLSKLCFQAGWEPSRTIQRALIHKMIERDKKYTNSQ